MKKIGEKVLTNREKSGILPKDKEEEHVSHPTADACAVNIWRNVRLYYCAKLYVGFAFFIVKYFTEVSSHR